MKMSSVSTTPVKTIIMKVGAFGLGAIRLKQVAAGQQVPLILNLANTEPMLTFPLERFRFQAWISANQSG